MKVKTNNYDYVDLGLSSGTLWATCNIGANSPEEYGKYFAWGETEGYYIDEEHNFDWCNYTYAHETDEGSFEMAKYNMNERFGPVDNKFELELNDDVAHVNMGGDWKMPTSAQMDELFNETNHEWVDDYQGTGINGCLFISKSDSSKSIFIPASGSRWDTSGYDQGDYVYLWSSTLYASGPSSGVSGIFYSDDFSEDFCVRDLGRCSGCCVRSVLNKKQ